MGNKRIPKKSVKATAGVADEIDTIVEVAKEDTSKVIGESYVHNRFKRKVWAFVDTFTSFMAKNLVLLSPYTVPDNFALCIEKFHNALLETFVFDSPKMVEINLIGLPDIIYNIIKDIPEFQALEVPKMKGINDSRNLDNRNPDYDSISLECLANSIMVDFATREDADCWLERTNEKE